MMSFLALNLQVAEASVAMQEMPIATAAKEIAIRQAMAFPFLEDACIGEPGHHAGVWTSACANAGSPVSDLVECSAVVILRGPVIALAAGCMH